MGIEEWELLLGVNIMSEPMGQAFVDALALVRVNGYHKRGEEIDPVSAFDLPNLVDAVHSDELESSYHAESLRALRQRLSALSTTGLFSSTGTRISELLGTRPAHGRDAWKAPPELPHRDRCGAYANADRGTKYGWVR